MTPEKIRELAETKDNEIVNHVRNVKLLQALYSGKKFFIECFPTDIGAKHFPNSNFAVKEIELPEFKLYEEEKFGYKWVAGSPNMSYDSTNDTVKHIGTVQDLLFSAAEELANRAMRHDASKLCSPEKELFDEYTPKLAACTYGSDEYKQFLLEIKSALDHHYSQNSHHPEHYTNGVNGMNLFDLVEMFLDWKAATERHNDGDILKSIEINEKRFEISPQISDIFRNTVKWLEIKSSGEQKQKV